jgi:hypothetical protein
LVVRTYVEEEWDEDFLQEVDMGVPERQWGLLMSEGWEVDGERMESAVDMVVEEAVRRGIWGQEGLVEIVLGGEEGMEGWKDGLLGKKERRVVVGELDDRFGIVEECEESASSDEGDDSDEASESEDDEDMDRT